MTRSNNDLVVGYAERLGAALEPSEPGAEGKKCPKDAATVPDGLRQPREAATGRGGAGLGCDARG